MTSLITIKREIQKIQQKVQPTPKKYLKVWVAECLIARRECIVDTKIDDDGRKWVAFLVECE